MFKASRYFGFGLVVAVGTIGACSSDDTGSGNTGGTGSGQAGTQSVAGTTSTAGAGMGGSGTAGSGTAGSGTAGSAAGSGGSGGSGTEGFKCGGQKPTANVLQDFEMTTPDATNAGQVTFATPFPGGTYVYPATLTVDVTNKALNVKGNIATYSGFGIYLNACLDAAGAGATGISFNITGNVGPSMSVSFRVQTNANTAIHPTYMKGACPLPPGTDPDGDVWTYCQPGRVNVNVPEGGGEVSVTWAQLLEGLPVATIDGSDIMGVEWALSWEDAGTPYDIDVTVDDIKFTGTLMGGGGMGGAGGGGGTDGGGAGGGGAGGGGAGGGGTGGDGGTAGTNP